MLQAEFGYGQVINFENHLPFECYDPFQTPETLERAQWYGVNSAPDVRVDGKYSVVGAASCAAAYAQYRETYLQRRQETGGFSPIEITGSYAVATGRISMRAVFRLVDPVAVPDLRATFVVYEDSVEATGNGFYSDEWQHTTRVIRNEPLLLLGQGDADTVVATSSIPTSVNLEHLHVVALAQRESGSREIHQAAFLPCDFTLTVTRPRRSVPFGDGDAEFGARVTNPGPHTRTITLGPGSVADPEGSFGDWGFSYTDCGGTSFQSGFTDIVLGPGEECPLRIRVHTDGTREVRAGGLLAASQGLGVEGRMRVFNGSPAVLLVGSGYYDSNPIMGAVMSDLGYLFDHRDPMAAPPLSPDLAGYDILAWDAEYSTPTVMIADSVMQRFADGGGAILLAGQGILDAHPLNGFLHDYFGVEERLLDQRYLSLVGVAGDPIGDGLQYTLHFSNPALNHDDLVRGGPQASPVLIASPTWPCAIRYRTPVGSRTVLLAFPFGTIDPLTPAPNDPATLLGRILAWLSPSAASSVPTAPEASPASALGLPSPNPSEGGVNLPLVLSPRAAGSPVRLEVFDAAGRLRRTLLDGRLEAGTHAQRWNGQGDRDLPVPGGIYFVRLSTVDGVSTRKLILRRN